MLVTYIIKPYDESVIKMNLTISCLQIDIKFGDPIFNYNEVEKKIIQLLKTNDADVIILPELWTTGYDLTRLNEIADVDGEKTVQFLSELAKKYQVNIVGGSIAKKNDTHITNTMFIVNRNGELVHEYSKLHLFKLMDEHHYLQAGNKLGLFELEGIKSSAVICYDIRFPEWIRAHTTRGAEVLFVVAQWPKPRLDHWLTLLKSRAIENQCYVVACNRVGSDPNNVFGGHSLIIDPWGEILAEAGQDEETITATLDFNKVKEVRSQIPIFADRLPSFYD